MYVCVYTTLVSTLIAHGIIISQISIELSIGHTSKEKDTTIEKY